MSETTMTDIYESLTPEEQGVFALWEDEMREALFVQGEVSGIRMAIAHLKENGYPVQAEVVRDILEGESQ